MGERTNVEAVMPMALRTQRSWANAVRASSPFRRHLGSAGIPDHPRGCMALFSCFPTLSGVCFRFTEQKRGETS